MAANIQVVLREDVAKLGKTGQVVRVKPGYARNFLIPRGLATIATKASIERIEHEKKAALARAARLKTSADAVAQKIAALELEIAKPAGEEGKLYGAVTTKDIAEVLHAKGFEIDRKKLALAEPIKALGTYEVVAKLASEVSATFKVAVVRK